MRIEDYYIQKIDDPGHKNVASIIFYDKDISNEEKLDLCIQLFELDHEKGPIEVWKDLYNQFGYNEKHKLWELYRKYLTARKAVPKRLILESILNEFSNDIEFINETLVYVFENEEMQQVENLIKKFADEYSRETHELLNKLGLLNTK